MTRTFNSFINVQNPGYNIQYRRLKNNLLISSKRKNDIINLELRTFSHAKRALYHCVTTPYFKGFRKKNGRRKGKRSEKCSPNFYMLILSYFCFCRIYIYNHSIVVNSPDLSSGPPMGSWVQSPHNSSHRS